MRPPKLAISTMNISFPTRSVDVLHIDDDADIREIIGTAVGSDPIFTVRSCASGEEALAATANWSPDLILLDLNMPGMDGPTTLARLNKQPQTAGVPVIYITGVARAKALQDPALPRRRRHHRQTIRSDDIMLANQRDPLPLSSQAGKLQSGSWSEKPRLALRSSNPRRTRSSRKTSTEPSCHGTQAPSACWGLPLMT